ncbi:MAG TPA: hypothetical protein VF101_17380 [Gaiellaceae bacterium]
MAHGLTRFWIEFDLQPGLPVVARGGVGVTALDRDDALRLVDERIFEGEPLPPITELREHVDVSTLDEGHVIPNMEPPHTRGIWFPRGYS